MSRAPLVLREPRAKDAEALAAVHLRAWQAAYRGTLPQGYLDTIGLDRRIEQWQEWVAHGRYPATTIVVAEHDGKVVGFAIHGPESPAEGDDRSDDVGELYCLNVHPDHWGAGIGHALITHVSRALEAADHSEAVLWVLTENRRARRVYERLRWLADGARRTDATQGVDVDEVRYQRSLA